MNSDKKGGDHQQQDQPQQQQQHNLQSQNSTKSTNRSTELTAEWTVHAQLTISRPDDQSTTDDRQNPVRVVYKWSSDNTKPAANEDQSKQPDSSSYTSKDKHDSFHSTTTNNDKPPSDSGVSSSNISRKPYGTRCKSTCSIVLSAVADFLPTNTEVPEEPDPFYFHTTSTYNVLPDQTIDETTNASQSFATSKTLSLRDAFCQTSDTESTALRSKMHPGSKDETSQRKLYDYRRQTESMLPPPVADEGDPFLPSNAKGSSQQLYYPSPAALQQPPGAVFPTNTTLSRRDSTTEKSDSKKPPRTVHIDVYCTGSDIEDDDDDDDDEVDDASSQSSSNNPNEIESNSTPQTVFNTEQMRLRHQRAGRNDLPRRLMAQMAQHQPQQQQTYNKTSKNQNQQQPSFPAANQTHIYEPDSPPILQHLGHTLSHSNTADEISESKQILFKKHIGDQKNKLNFRSRNFRRDQSDDAISSNYPNSSRSTMRDMTCSSISSAIASTSAIYEDIDTSWKETEIEPEIATITSVGKSDSFEYDNSVDRARIKKMERFWGQPVAPSLNELTIPQTNQNLQQKQRIQEFLQGYHGPPPRSYHDTLSSEYDNAFETDHSFSYSRQAIPERDESVEEAPAIPQIHRMTLKPGFMQDQQPASRISPDPPRRLLYRQPEYIKSGSETSTLQSNLSGYTSDYLQKARRFGAVVTALRKPGHHIGPSKNPDCQCEHCRRWMAERVDGRGRAYSTGDSPFAEPHFWLRRSTPGV